MSFLYPRVITISRPNPTTGIGALPYQGLEPYNETVLFSGIPASIQYRGNTNAIGLPADAKSEPCWVVIIPSSQIPLASSNIQSIQERDIITDDLGNRYQVFSGYWNSLGYQAECEKLQT